MKKTWAVLLGVLAAACGQAPEQVDIEVVQAGEVQAAPEGEENLEGEVEELIHLDEGGEWFHDDGTVPGSPLLPDETLSELTPDAEADADPAAVVAAPSDMPIPPAPASCPRARVNVANGNELNVRAQPTRGARILTQLADGFLATVDGQTTGDSVEGNRTWYRVRAGGDVGFASARYMTCTQAEPPITQTCPRVEIDVGSGSSLNVRPTPSTDRAAVTQLQDGRVVTVLAAAEGQAVNGNRRWYRVNAGGTTGYVSAAFADCTRATPVQPPPANVGYKTPLQCGTRARIVQGNFGSYSHQGRTAYAWDYSIPSGTPLTAMMDGRVKYTYKATGPGHRCYNGGGSDCYPYSNMVVLKHPDGTTSQYKHMNRVDVNVGQTVRRGQVLGLSGSTGYSTGPHAHVMRMTDCGLPNCQSVRTVFVDQPGDGIPNQGATVQSGNCR